MAMGLASMNPIPGGGVGALFIRQKPDKDLERDPWAQYGVTTDFDSNDRVTMSQGKVILKRNNDLRECMVYKINTDDAHKIYDALLKEAMLEDENKRQHDLGYLYSCFTGHYLLTEDQFDYDPLLERVYLDKLSKSLNAGATTLDFEAAGRENKKESKPFETKRLGEEDDAGTIFPMLASYHLIGEEELEKLNEYFDILMSGESDEIVEDI